MISIGPCPQSCNGDCQMPLQGNFVILITLAKSNDAVSLSTERKWGMHLIIYLDIHVSDRVLPDKDSKNWLLVVTARRVCYYNYPMKISWHHRCFCPRDDRKSSQIRSADFRQKSRNFPARENFLFYSIWLIDGLDPAMPTKNNAIFMLICLS